MMINAWKLDGNPSNRSGWAGKWTGQSFNPDTMNKWTAANHPGLNRGGVARAAPYGTSQDDRDY